LAPHLVEGDLKAIFAALAAALTLTTAGCASQPPVRQSIGTATMSQDGTLTLDLVARSSRGAGGEGRVVYKPGDPDYKAVLEHVGPIKPGETKPVAPWPGDE
jgi:hypothetical protein